MKAALLTIVIAALLGGGGVYVWEYFGGFTSEKGHVVEFINYYGDYKVIASEVETAVHAPGSEGNNDRAQLEQLLTTLLTEQLTPERREELARLAYNNLMVLRREVDDAQSKQAGLYQALEKLDASSKSFSGTGLLKQSGDIVTLARKRAELSARITSILSEMNEQTYAILTKILQDRGELTREHIQYINDTTDQAEQRFNTLVDVYGELERKVSETDILFAQFVKTGV